MAPTPAAGAAYRRWPVRSTRSDQRASHALALSFSTSISFLGRPWALDSTALK